MSRLLGLARHLGRDFLRHRLMAFVLVLFPALLVLMAVRSAREGTTPLAVGGTPVLPEPASVDVQVAAFALTAVVLVGALTAFFVGFQLRTVTPRLRLVGYRAAHVQGALVLLLAAAIAFSTATTGTLALLWLEPRHLGATYAALFLGGALFALLGLVVARVVRIRTLGLNLILTLAVLDTAFLENPVLSRRFDEAWIGAMPAHHPVELLYEAAFAARVDWAAHAAAVALHATVALLALLAADRWVRD